MNSTIVIPAPEVQKHHLEMLGVYIGERANMGFSYCDLLYAPPETINVVLTGHGYSLHRGTISGDGRGSLSGDGSIPTALRISWHTTTNNIVTHSKQLITAYDALVITDTKRQPTAKLLEHVEAKLEIAHKNEFLSVSMQVDGNLGEIQNLVYYYTKKKRIHATILESNPRCICFTFSPEPVVKDVGDSPKPPTKKTKEK